jgi:hypothetical protein
LGAEFQDLCHHASEQQWGVSDRQLWRYIAAGDKMLAETLERDREKIINRHIAQRRALFARCMSVSDYRTGLATLRDEGELLNIYPPRKTELTGQGGGPVQHEHVMTIAERREAVLELVHAVARREGITVVVQKKNPPELPSTSGAGASGDGSAPAG